MNENSTRNVYPALLVLGFLIIIVGIILAYFCIQQSSTGNSGLTGTYEVNTIGVSGTGTVTMPPDESIVYLGVQTQSADSVTAQQNNAEKMEKVLKALIDIGIDEKDIVTSSYNLYPIRDYEKTEPEITGYVVSNQLKITVKDINQVGDLIDVAVDAGANEVQSVSFTLSDETQQVAREQAIKNAIIAARSDADNLAESLNVRITGPLQVTTSGGGIVTPFEAAVERSVATPIQPGDVSITAYVQIIYGFE